MNHYLILVILSAALLGSENKQETVAGDQGNKEKNAVKGYFGETKDIPPPGPRKYP